MSIKKTTMVSTACLIVCASAATAQTSVDKSFTAVSKDCNGIQWSERALTTYPTIASACQGVEERNGKTFVKFQGTLKKNVNRGEQLVVNFKDGGEVTLTPPPETSFYVNGKKTKVSEPEWQQRIAELRAEAHRWLGVVRTPREVDEDGLKGLIGSIAHLAYHLGAIRQMKQATRGPVEGDGK